MDWVDKSQNFGSIRICMVLCNFCEVPIWTILKLGWVAFYSEAFQLKCLDFQSTQYKKLVPVLSRFCNWLYAETQRNARLQSRYQSLMRPMARWELMMDAPSRTYRRISNVILSYLHTPVESVPEAMEIDEGNCSPFSNCRHDYVVWTPRLNLHRTSLVFMDAKQFLRARFRH